MKDTNELKTGISEIIKIIGSLNAKNVERICNKIDISIEDLYYLFRMFFHNNLEMNTNDKITSERLAKELIQGMKDITNEVANDIVICNKESKLYNFSNNNESYTIGDYSIIIFQQN